MCSLFSLFSFMRAIWGVDSAEQVRLLSPIWMVVWYNGGNSREDRESSMRKQILITENALLVLSLAEKEVVIIDGVRRTILQILQESYKLGKSWNPMNSWWTLYEKESKAILEFINRTIADIQKPKPLSPEVGKISQWTSSANDSELQIRA